MKYKGHELVEITEPQVFNPPKEMLVWDECDEEEILKGKYEPQRVMVYGIIATTGGRVVALFNGDMVYFEKCAEIPEEPKQRRATNREVSKWLAQGNGEIVDMDNDQTAWTLLQYLSGNENRELLEGFKVRKWDDEEFHEPTIDYLGIKEG